MFHYEEVRVMTLNAPGAARTIVAEHRLHVLRGLRVVLQGAVARGLQRKSSVSKNYAKPDWTIIAPDQAESRPHLQLAA